MHVRQLQPVLHPPSDVVLDRQQPVPRVPVPAGAFRADRVDHLPDQLVGELTQPALATHPQSDRGIDVTADRFAVDTGPLSDRSLTELATNPMP